MTGDTLGAHYLIFRSLSRSCDPPHNLYEHEDTCAVSAAGASCDAPAVVTTRLPIYSNAGVSCLTVPTVSTKQAPGSRGGACNLHRERDNHMKTVIRDAESFASALSAKLLHCRELGHEWRDSSVSFDASARVFNRSLVCRSCKCVRRQVLDLRGHVLANSYKYPEGYLATAVEDRSSLSRDVFRVEAITRWFHSHNRQKMKAVS